MERKGEGDIHEVIKSHGDYVGNIEQVQRIVDTVRKGKKGIG